MSSRKETTKLPAIGDNVGVLATLLSGKDGSVLAQMKPSSTIAAHAKQPAQPPAPLPSTATLPAILATPSIMSLVEVRPPSPSAIVQPGRSLNPWDPEDVNYVRPTIEELDERGIYTLARQHKFPVHADYSKAFARPDASEAILSHKPVRVSERETNVQPTSRQLRDNKYDGYNAYAVRYAKGHGPESDDDDSAQEQPDDDIDVDAIYSSTNQLNYRPRVPSLEDLYVLQRESTKDKPTTATSNRRSSTSSTVHKLTRPGSGSPDIMSQDAPHSAKSAHRAPRTIRRVLDANTHTLSWNQLDPAVQTALSNTELRALFNRLAVDMVAFHKNVQQRAENAYTIFKSDQMFFMRGPSWTDADTILEDITTQDVDIVLRNGKPMEASLPFVNFKKANEARWGSIAVVLKHAEFVAKRYSLNCWALKAASIEVLAARIYNGQANPTSKDIMELSAVPEVTLMIAQRTGQRFIGELGKHNAAVLIQSVYKMYKTRCCYRRVQPYIHAGRVFLKYHRVHYRKTPLRATKDSIDEFHLKRVAELQKGMAKLWADKSLSKTVVIVSSVHVDPELKLHKSSTSYLHQRYFARAALLIDSKVNVIFVSSQDESEEVLNYRRTLMELHPEIQDFDQRFQVVVPEQHAMLKPNSSVAAMLLSSFATIQQIKAMIKGKAAFLFPGAVTMQEYRVASILEVPIYAPKLYLTKKLCKMSYARELAMDLGIPTPVGAESIESKEAFYERLSELICAHPEVTRWLFVVEHGIFMHQQIAYLDMHRFDFVRNCDALTLVPHLIAKLKEVVQILDGHRFNNSWEHYLEKLSRSHGTILAAYYDTNGREPIMDRTCLIHVDIDPRGAITYRGSTDMVTSEPHRILLEAIPQTRMPFSMVWAHTLRICERIHKLGGIGHFSVEFAVSTQKMMVDSDQQIMLLRIYPYYTQQAINCDLAVVMGDASFEEASGKLMHDVHALMRRRIEFLKQARFFDMKTVYTEGAMALESPRWEERHVVFSDALTHSNFEFIDHPIFESLANTTGINFDVRDRKGTIFLQHDTYEPERLPLLCMHGSRKSALDLLAAQLFVFQQLLSASTSSDSAVELLESDNFLQVMRRLWELDEETLGERASSRESAASKDDLLSSVEGFLTSTVVKQTLKKQLDTIMASNAQSTAVLERLLADSKEMAELKRIEAEEQREKAEAERFKNPGTAIWSNPYAKTTEDPALAKRRIMSTFVVEELLADVIFASAFDRIAAIETQREDEQRACDMEVEQQRKFDEECKKQQIEQLQKDLAAQNDADAGAGAGARGKKGNLRDNTAIKTLRKMFQASHMFQASVDKDGGEAGAAANAMAGSGDEDDDGEEEEDDSNVVIVSDSDE